MQFADQMPEAVDPIRAGIALVAWLVAAVLVDPFATPPALLAGGVLALGFFTVSAHDAVREHRAFALVQNATLAAVFGLFYLAEPRPVVGVLAIFAVGGVAVELYNLATGSTVLRLGPSN